MSLQRRHSRIVLEDDNFSFQDEFAPHTAHNLPSAPLCLYCLLVSVLRTAYGFIIDLQKLSFFLVKLSPDADCSPAKALLVNEFSNSPYAMRAKKV
jgi:hypothetical protein